MATFVDKLERNGLFTITRFLALVVVFLLALALIGIVVFGTGGFKTAPSTAVGPDEVVSTFRAIPIDAGVSTFERLGRFANQ